MQPKPGTNVFYHGTSIEAALSIQKTGFLVSKSGSYKGAMLGPGLYVTTTLEKAINYATGKKRPDGGAVFVLHVDLGNCYTVRHNDPYIRKWQEEGYDSAWSGEGVNGQREEHCIKDPRPPRVQIVDVIFGNTRKATAAGFSVVNGRICKAGEAPHLANSMGGSGVVEQWVQPYPKITAEQLEGCYICMCFPLALLYVAPGTALFYKRAEGPDTFVDEGCCLVFPFKEPHDRDPGTNVFRQRSDPSKAYHYTHVGGTHCFGPICETKLS